MSLALAILGIVAALMPFLVRLLSRHLERSDSPAFQQQQTDEEIDRLIITGDQRGVNRFVDDRLRSLQGDSSRQGDNPSEGEPTNHSPG